MARCDLSQLSFSTIQRETLEKESDVPATGESQVIVAKIDDLLHFRIFDGQGKLVRSSNEGELGVQGEHLAIVKARLNGLWDKKNLTKAEQLAVVTAVASLLDYTNVRSVEFGNSGIDPWGIPFEQFDAGGLLKKKAVDARSTLPDETEVANLSELKSYLASKRIDQVAFSFLKHLASYAVGRSLSYNEIEFLKEKGIELKSSGYRMQDMIRFVIKSKLFLEK